MPFALSYKKTTFIGESKTNRIYKFGAKWVKDLAKCDTYFDKKGMKKEIKCLLIKCYFFCTLFSKLLFLPLREEQDART